MKKSILIFVLTAIILLANSQTIQGLTKIKIDPKISVDSLVAHCTDISPKINAKNFEIIESEPYMVEAKVFYFSSAVNRDSILKFMLEQGFVPANFLESIIIASTIKDFSLFPLIAFGAEFRSATSDDDFVLYVDKSVWGCELSVVPQHYGKQWKKSYKFLGVKREFFIK